MHPLEPYAYEVEYRDGRRLRWDSPGGPWGEARLPTEGATRLIVFHPTAGPLTVEVSDWITGFALRASVALTFPGPRVRVRRFLFGVRFGELVRGWRIDAKGHAHPYHGPLLGW
jgi:hypothetical protein